MNADFLGIKGTPASAGHHAAFGTLLSCPRDVIVLNDKFDRTLGVLNWHSVYFLYSRHFILLLLGCTQLHGHGWRCGGGSRVALIRKLTDGVAKPHLIA